MNSLQWLGTNSLLKMQINRQIDFLSVVFGVLQRQLVFTIHIKVSPASY